MILQKSIEYADILHSYRLLLLLCYYYKCWEQFMLLNNFVEIDESSEESNWHFLTNNINV